MSYQKEDDDYLLAEVLALVFGLGLVAAIIWGTVAWLL